MNGISAFTGISNLTNYGAIQSNGASEISGLSSLTNSGTIEVQSGSLKLDAGLSGTGALTIDAGSTLELASGASSGQTITFTSNNGILKLDGAQNFKGVVAGLSSLDGTQAHSDQIDLANINHDSTTFSENYDSVANTLTVSDGTNTAVIHLVGSYTNSSFNFVDDGNQIGGVSGTSGTIIYDPPATGGQAVGVVGVHDPEPVAGQTIVASAPNQALVGSGVSDNFVFSFATIGRDTVTNFNPASDMIQFGSSIFANAQAVLAAAQDDGLGNTVIAIDSHDTVTLTNVLKAQLHATDFHIV
jgi:hypothetical protein